MRRCLALPSSLVAEHPAKNNKVYLFKTSTITGKGIKPLTCQVKSIHTMQATQ